MYDLNTIDFAELPVDRRRLRRDVRWCERATLTTMESHHTRETTSNRLGIDIKYRNS
jgi:hypothetical protein